MNVRFLRNPDTGEVKRFFRSPSGWPNTNAFEGWEVVDWTVWADANADLPTVGAAIARYRAEHGIKASDELAPAQPATADAGERDTLAGVDKVGILEKYLREGKTISAIKAHRRFYGTDIGEAGEALKLMKYDMQLREDSQPSYSELQAKLAAAEALAATNASLLANAQSELGIVRGERDAALAFYALMVSSAKMVYIPFDDWDKFRDNVYKGFA